MSYKRYWLRAGSAGLEVVERGVALAAELDRHVVDAALDVLAVGAAPDEDADRAFEARRRQRRVRMRGQELLERGVAVAGVAVLAEPHVRQREVRPERRPRRR